MQEEENSAFHTIYGILSIMFDLHVPKIIPYLIERVVFFSLSFLFSNSPFSGNINSWRSYYENIFLLVGFVSCDCELLFAYLIVFVINNFYKQLYVKDS